jgi:hypothetical protein
MLKNFDTTASPLLQDRVFRLLRQRMLRQCVDCDGASSITELTEFLEIERSSGKASPLPTWYRFKRTDDRLGALGLRRCCARGCFRVESEQLKMKKCSKCVARYCSASCQTTDWKDRHKAMCATVMKTLKDSARTAGAGDEGSEGTPEVEGCPPMPEDIGSLTFAAMMQRLAETPEMRESTANAMANAPPDMRAILAEGIPPEVLFNIMGMGNGGMPEINMDLMR